MFGGENGTTPIAPVHPFVSTRHISAIAGDNDISTRGPKRGSIDNLSNTADLEDLPDDDSFRPRLDSDSGLPTSADSSGDVPSTATSCNGNERTTGRTTLEKMTTAETTKSLFANSPPGWAAVVPSLDMAGSRGGITGLQPRSRKEKVSAWVATILRTATRWWNGKGVGVGATPPPVAGQVDAVHLKLPPGTQPEISSRQLFILRLQLICGEFGISFGSPFQGLAAATSFFAQWIGLGRSPLSILSWNQWLWYLVNRHILQDHCDLTFDFSAAEYQQTEIAIHDGLGCGARSRGRKHGADNACSRVLFAKCPKLDAMGEPDFVWDPFQMLTFLASGGYFYAERHAAETKDGHLLVLHRLVRVRDSLAQRFIQMQKLTFIRVFFFFLVRWWRRAATIMVSDPAGIQVDTCTTTDTTTASGGVLHVSPAHSLGLVDGASESEQASSPGGISASDPFQFNRYPPISIDYSPSPVATQTHRPRRQVVLFQHGLMESSVNWIGQAAPMETTRRGIKGLVCWIIDELKEIICVTLEFFARATDEIVFPPIGTNGPIPLETLRQSMPFDLLFSTAVGASSATSEGLHYPYGVDCWFGNTRGNYFTEEIKALTKRNYTSCPLRGFCTLTSRHAVSNFPAIMNQDWTYNDIAVYDIEAIYQTIRRVVQPGAGDIGDVGSATDDAALRPICIGFSQGAATVALHTAFREFINHRMDPGLLLEPVLPKALVLLSPPLRLQPLGQVAPRFKQLQEQASASLTESVKRRCFDICPRMRGATNHFAASVLIYLANYHFGLLSGVIEGLYYLAPKKPLLHFASLFVRRVLGFILTPLRSEVARWIYCLTPCGFTSRRNLNLYFERMAYDETLGGHFGQHVAWKNFRLHEDATRNELLIKRLRTADLECLKLAARCCALHIWMGGSDNIAAPERAAETILNECQHAEFRRYSTNSLRRRENDTRRYGSARERPGRAVTAVGMPSTSTADGLSSLPPSGAVSTISGGLIVSPEDLTIPRMNSPSQAATLFSNSVVLAHPVTVTTVDYLSHLDLNWAPGRNKDMFPMLWRDLAQTVAELDEE